VNFEFARFDGGGRGGWKRGLVEAFEFHGVSSLASGGREQCRLLQ
jgi:hypothetical protein